MFLRAALAAVLLTLGGGVLAAPSRDDFRMPIVDAFSISNRGVVLTGRVAAGEAKVGDWVCVPMQDGTVIGRRIAGLEMLSEVPDHVEAGQNAGVMVENVSPTLIAKSADLVAGCAEGG